MKKYIVYIHINKVNGKKYIGKTCQKFEHRCGIDGVKYSKQRLFWRAIQKYGWNNFEHIIMFENLSKETSASYEAFLIKFYNTTNPKMGYNVVLGGEGTPGYKHTDEAKEKMRQVQLGHIRSEESRRKQSESLKRNIELENRKPWIAGKHHTPETLKKISESSRRQSIKQYGDKYIYNGLARPEYTGKHICEICELEKLNITNVRYRISKFHWPIDEALEFVPHEKKPVQRKRGYKLDKSKIKHSEKYIYENPESKYNGWHILDIADELGLNSKTVQSRVREYGWSMDEALGFVKRIDSRRKDRIYNGIREEYNGMYISDICHILGFATEKIAQRLRYGWSFDEALEFVKRPNNQYIYNGIKKEYAGMPVCEICKTLKLNADRVRQRIWHGWSFDEALGFIPREKN